MSAVCASRSGSLHVVSVLRPPSSLVGQVGLGLLKTRFPYSQPSWAPSHIGVFTPSSPPRVRTSIYRTKTCRAANCTSGESARLARFRSGLPCHVSGGRWVPVASSLCRGSNPDYMGGNHALCQLSYSAWWSASFRRGTMPTRLCVGGFLLAMSKPVSCATQS